MVVTIECSQCLRERIGISYSHFYRGDQSILFIYHDESDLCSRLLPIEIEIMSRFELTQELYEDEILEGSLLHLSLIVDTSEDSSEIVELSEVDLHVSCRLSLCMVSPWTKWLDDTMFHEKLSILMDLPP